MKNTTKLFIAAAFLSVGMASAQSGVGVGTTTPATGTALHVDGAKDNTSVTPTATEAANDVVVTSTGKVGIGTAAPDVKLDVLTTVGANTIRSKTDDDTSFSSVHVRAANSAILYNYAFGSTYAQPSGYDIFRPGSTVTNSSAINGHAFVSSNSSNEGSFRFYTSGLSASNLRMLIDKDGKIGVGVDTPIEKIDVAGAILAGSPSSSFGVELLKGRFLDGSLGQLTSIGSLRSSSATYMALGLKADNVNSNSYVSSTTLAFARSAIDVNGGFIRFHVGDTQTVAIDGAVTLTEAMRIVSTGNVGIGTTAPTEKLEVNGAIKIGSNSAATPTAGTIRFNSTTNKFEGYDGTAWVAFH